MQLGLPTGLSSVHQNCTDATASVYPVPTGCSGDTASVHPVPTENVELAHFILSLSSFFVLRFAWPFCFIPGIYNSSLDKLISLINCIVTQSPKSQNNGLMRPFSLHIHVVVGQTIAPLLRANGLEVSKVCDIYMHEAARMADSEAVSPRVSGWFFQ